MMLRGILRNRRRTTLTVLGVALSVALVMVFAGLRDTVTTVIDRQFTTIQLEDAEVHVAPAAASTVLERLRQDSRVAAAEPFRRYDVTLRGPRGSYQTLLTAVDRNTVMHRFVGTDGHTLRLPADGILLGVGTRGQLGAEVGDRVSVTVFPGGRRLTERVAGFVDEPLNPVAYIALDHLPRAVATAGTGGILVRLAPGQDTAGTARSLAALPGVLAYLSTSSAEQTIQEAFSLYSALVTLMLVFAAVMAAALLYNAMSANVAERGVELGTLQAAGMTQGMLGRLVAAENLLLAVLGIPLGLLAGTWAARWFMSSYETQGYRWTVTMQPTTPLVVALGVLLAAVAAQWPAFRTLRRMDLARIVRERSL
jgi:putative ABC transport system permease protein